MKLLLKHPLTVGKATIEALTFRDHTTAADYLAFDVKGGVAQNIALIANLSGTDESLIRQLHGQDYRAATRVVDQLMLADDALIEADSPEKKPCAS
ncbi:MAG: phage tail assembly protein [Zoogloeaceae bacterium]|jgi:hypothetical protein|nr:phage tail assembly protein [Zoogloeaceae bacterium]